MIGRILWYGLLGLLTLPFVAFALAFARSRPNEVSPPLDRAFAFTAISWFGFMGAAIIAALFWTAVSPGAGFWIYVRNGAIVAVVGILVGLLAGFPMTMYAASHTYPMATRRSAVGIVLLIVAGFLTFCVLAMVRYRRR